MKYDILIIDGPYLAHRSYTAPYKLTTLEGKDSTMIHTFLQTILSIRKKQDIGEITVAWESHGTPSWRRELSPTYKPSNGADEDFLEQLNDIKRLLNIIGLRQFYAPNNEADDVIATLTKNSKKSILIYTVDKDIMQLTSDIQQHHILCNKKVLTEQDIINKFGVYPYQIPDYLALVGDKADNIEGVKGIGKKKASQILKEQGSLLVAEPETFKKEEHLEQAKFNRQLTLLNYDANVQLLFENISFNTTLEDILNKYELVSLKKRKQELINLRYGGN